MFGTRLGLTLRRFSTSALKRSEHGDGGIPGANLPFPIKNRFVLTGLFTLFFGSGFSAPFLILRHQLLKK